MKSNKKYWLFAEQKARDIVPATKHKQVDYKRDRKLITMYFRFHEVKGIVDKLSKEFKISDTSVYNVLNKYGAIEAVKEIPGNPLTNW